MAGRESDPDYEVNANQHRFTMPFDEFVAKMRAVGAPIQTFTVPNADHSTEWWDRMLNPAKGLHQLLVKFVKTNAGTNGA